MKKEAPNNPFENNHQDSAPASTEVKAPRRHSGSKVVISIAVVLLTVLVLCGCLFLYWSSTIDRIAAEFSAKNYPAAEELIDNTPSILLRVKSDKIEAAVKEQLSALFDTIHTYKDVNLENIEAVKELETVLSALNTKSEFAYGRYLNAAVQMRTVLEENLEAAQYIECVNEHPLLNILERTVEAFNYGGAESVLQNVRYHSQQIVEKYGKENMLIRSYRSNLIKVISILKDLVWANEDKPDYLDTSSWEWESTSNGFREDAYNKFNSLITELQIPTKNPDVEALRLEAVIEEGIAKARLFLG